MITADRMSWDDTMLALVAVLASARADCRRSKHAAIIFDERTNDIISLGYNGYPSGQGSCLAGDCPRGLLSKEAVPELADYSSGPGRCYAVHAEANAIIRAGLRARGCTIYITGAPCHGCSVLIQGVGITRVVYP